VRSNTEHAHPTYDLVDLATGGRVGQLSDNGSLCVTDARVRARLLKAFHRELLVRDGEIVEELGVCFADVETLRPGDPGHREIVLRHLARLAGILPVERVDDAE
jgi:hypothetical protein